MSNNCITLYYLKRSVLNTKVGDSQRKKKVWPTLSLKYHTVETVRPADRPSKHKEPVEIIQSEQKQRIKIKMFQRPVGTPSSIPIHACGSHRRGAGGKKGYLRK